MSRSKAMVTVILFPLLLIVAKGFRMSQLYRQRAGRVSLMPLPRKGMFAGPMEQQKSGFDIALAVILAGYAFESYNEPSVGKVATGLDNTKVTFTSTEFIRRAFSGVLLLSLNKGTFKTDAIEEEQLLEKMISGSDPDPYVSISVVEPGARRVLDAVRSTEKANTANPEWRESFLLYVTEPKEATLAFRAMDKDYFKEDDLIGIGAISVDELQSNTEISGFGMGGIPVPLYLENHDKNNGKPVAAAAAAASLPQTAKRKKMKRSGTLQVDAQFIPWDVNNKLTVDRESQQQQQQQQSKSSNIKNQEAAPAAAAAVTAKRKNILLPTGASPGLVDWPSLMGTVVDRDRAQRLYARTHTNAQQKLRTDMDDIAEGILLRSTANRKEMVTDVPVDVLTTNIKGGGGLAAVAPQTPSSAAFLKDEAEAALAVGSSFAVSVHTRCLADGVTNGLQPVCSLENTATDTQVSVWADFKGKQLVISFRGTEQVKFQDILTDINLIQTPYEATHPTLSKTLVHRGFLEAFLSVREALLQLIHQLLTLPSSLPLRPQDSDKDDVNTDNITSGDSVQHEGWNIFVTGHSLGGALATLMSFELGRLQTGLYTLPSEDSDLSSSSPISPSSAAKDKTEDKTGIKNAATATAKSSPRASVIKRSTPAAGGGSGWPFSSSISLPFFSNSNADKDSDNDADTEEGAAAALSSAFSWATEVFNSVVTGAGVGVGSEGGGAGGVTGTKSDPATVYMQDEQFKRELEKSHLTMYTFGAPRTGDPQFAELFDSLVPRGFRVVNNQDIVARIPRASKANRLLEYEHVGRTVMIDDAALGQLWIQGESPGECPVADISPFVDASSSRNYCADPMPTLASTAAATTTAASTMPLYEKDIAELQGKVNEAVTSVTDQLNQAASLVTGKYESRLQQFFTAANNLSAVGIDSFDTFTKGLPQIPSLPTTFPFTLQPQQQQQQQQPQGGRPTAHRRDEGTKLSLSFSVNNTEFSTQLGGELVIPSIDQLAQTGSEYLFNSTSLLADSLSQYIAANVSAPISQGLTDTTNQYLAALNTSAESLKLVTDSFSQQFMQSFGQIQLSLVGTTAPAVPPATLPASPSASSFATFPSSLVVPSAPNQLIEAALSATGLSTEDINQLLIVGQSFGDVASDVSRGIEDRFIEREMQMLSAILSGKALEHHLEPSYFVALQKAVQAAEEREVEEEKNKKENRLVA